MERLTQIDDFGNWSLKGVLWKDLYSGKVITENTEERIYAALCKLKDYEESGLDPEQVQQLKERDTEKRLDISSRCEEHTHYKCPACGNILMTEYKGYRRIGRITEFCDKCGQRLERGE